MNEEQYEPSFVMNEEEYEPSFVRHSNDLDETSEREVPVFTERTTITVQPRRTDDGHVPMPISTVDWRTTNFSHFIPLSGLDFLIGAEEIIIQQTVELQDILAYIESENRYLIKVPRGETLYYAAETSETLQRVCCGSSRGLVLKLFDHSRQQALILRRRLAGSYCCCGCYLQEMKIFSPQGDLLGVVEQEWTMLIPSFLIRDGSGTVIFVVEGPTYVPFRDYTGTDFKILSKDGLTQLASIKHEWNDVISTYNVKVTFPNPNLYPKDKALFIGAGFLLEYMFFEKDKRSNKCFNLCKAPR